MALSDQTIKTAKAGEKPRKLSDSLGLFLLITPAGGKLWRLKYRHGGKEKLLSFGGYPDVSLKAARAKRDEARAMLAAGIDPGENRKAQKAATTERATNSFEVIAREWLESRKEAVNDSQRAKTLARMVNDAFPWIGGKPIAEINAPMVLSVLRRVEQRGAGYSAHRLLSEISRAFRYAIATGRAERDPCPDLRGALSAIKAEHMAAITDPKLAGELLRAIDGFKGTFVVLSALRLAPLVFTRPGELRAAKWADIDLDAGEWAFFVTKTKTSHSVSLSAQAVAILRELQALTGTGVYVFPGARDKNRPMSDAAVNAALQRMGYNTKTEHTGHGFRAMARTILAERLHQKPEVIEHQLAHKVPDALGGAYNRTKFLDERRRMMQLWADYLDKLKAGAEVIPLHNAA